MSDPKPSDLLDELDIRPPRFQGNLARPLAAEYDRDLTEADIQALEGPRGANLPRSIQRVRTSHHALARCLATGMTMIQASQVTGYTINRIAILSNDPTFQGLLAAYAAESKEIFADMHERMSNLSMDALEELHQRLDETPEAFSIGMLLDVAKAFADRTGYGPGAEVKLTVSPTTIDRPPKETYEEWKARRARELGTPPEPEPDILGGMEPPAGPPN